MTREQEAVRQAAGSLRRAARAAGALAGDDVAARLLVGALSVFERQVVGGVEPVWCGLSTADYLTAVREAGRHGLDLRDYLKAAREAASHEMSVDDYLALDVDDLIDLHMAAVCTD